MTTWTRARDSALYAIERGYAVFPLSINKTPAIKSPHEKGHSCKGLRQCGSFGHGVGDASTVAADVRQGFDLAPRAAGYGIACDGQFIGLDLDRKNGVDGIATLNRLAQEHGFEIPRTMTVCTPSGGFHLWLTVPDGVAVPNSVGRVGEGIDVRSSRGYLVGPGSRGRNGQYSLHPSIGETEVLPVPEQLLKLMLPAPVPRPAPRITPTGDKAEAALNGLVRVVLGAPEGTRNDRLYWAAAKAWAHVGDGHIDAHTAEAALVDAAVSRGLAEAEALRTIASARRTTAGATR